MKNSVTLSKEEMMKFIVECYSRGAKDGVNEYKNRRLDLMDQRDIFINLKIKEIFK
jgi:hypothetical protein